MLGLGIGFGVYGLGLRLILDDSIGMRMGGMLPSERHEKNPQAPKLVTNSLDTWENDLSKLILS